MSFSVGIVGLPNVGKSTLFKALTKNKVDIAPYPFTTIHPNIGVVAVPDERLEKIAQVIKPDKITPTVIEFVDIAGIVKDAHKGEGLGNQFLAEIRNCDAILEVIRNFESPEIENVLGELNPKKEIEIIKTELLMKDLEALEKLIQKMEKETKEDKKILKKFGLFKKIKDEVSRENSISEIKLDDEEKKEIKECQFLTVKPIIYAFNFNKRQGLSPELKEHSFFSTLRFARVSEKKSSTRAAAKSKRQASFPLSLSRGESSVAEEEDLSSLTTAIHRTPTDSLLIDFKFEEELAEFPAEEAQQLRNGSASPLESIVISCYNILDLITFFTVARGKETRAWTLKKGLKAPEAGGVVHSDFKEKFIRSDVIPWESLVKSGSWKTAKESGLIKTVGKEYIVQDGDVIEFKI